MLCAAIFLLAIWAQAVRRAETAVVLPGGAAVREDVENALRCLIRTWIRRKLSNRLVRKISMEFQITGSHRFNNPITIQIVLSQPIIVIGQFKQCDPRISNPDFEHKIQQEKYRKKVEKI